jgi:hypothetical protein
VPRDAYGNSQQPAVVPKMVGVHSHEVDVRPTSQGVEIATVGCRSAEKGRDRCWGGVYGMVGRATERKGPGTVYTFVLGGTGKAPEFVAYQQGALLKDVKYDPAQVTEGRLLYVSNCAFCHGVPGVHRGGNEFGAGRDLRTRQVRVQGASR